MDLKILNLSQVTRIEIELTSSSYHTNGRPCISSTLHVGLVGPELEIATIRERVHDHLLKRLNSSVHSCQGGANASGQENSSRFQRSVAKEKVARLAFVIDHSMSFVAEAGSYQTYCIVQTLVVSARLSEEHIAGEVMSYFAVIFASTGDKDKLAKNCFPTEQSYRIFLRKAAFEIPMEVARHTIDQGWQISDTQAIDGTLRNILGTSQIKMIYILVQNNKVHYEVVLVKYLIRAFDGKLHVFRNYITKNRQVLPKLEKNIKDIDEKPDEEKS
ncbi:hypothetical protein TNCV_171481 [Trichonephila clavipes]|nr:hypothetical protein TNCV_171481 [Trichonephila clavipes]